MRSSLPALRASHSPPPCPSRTRSPTASLSLPGVPAVRAPSVQRPCAVPRSAFSPLSLSLSHTHTHTHSEPFSLHLSLCTRRTRHRVIIISARRKERKRESESEREYYPFFVLLFLFEKRINQIRERKRVTTNDEAFSSSASSIRTQSRDRETLTLKK